MSQRYRFSFIPLCLCLCCSLCLSSWTQPPVPAQLQRPLLWVLTPNARALPDAPGCIMPSSLLPGCYVVCVSLPTGLGGRWGTDHSFLFLGPQRSSACRAQRRTWVVWPVDIRPSQETPGWGEGGLGRELCTLGAMFPIAHLPSGPFPREAHCGGAHLCRAGSLGTCWRCQARRQPGGGIGGSPGVPCTSPGKGPFLPAGCAGR